MYLAHAKHKPADSRFFPCRRPAYGHANRPHRRRHCSSHLKYIAKIHTYIDKDQVHLKKCHLERLKEGIYRFYYLVFHV